MAPTYSLLEFVHQLASDDGLRAEFAADPQGVLADHGLDGLAAEDVRDALLLVDDTRTVEYHPDHSFDPGPSLDPAAGPDAVAQYFSDYAGLSTPAGFDGGFDVDHTGDIDDLDGYTVVEPHAAPVPAAEPAADGQTDAAAGFGHGFGHPQVAAEPAQPVETGPDDVGHHQSVDPGTAVPDPAFDEPGSYDEFGTADTFDHPHAYDHPVEEPGHPH